MKGDTEDFFWWQLRLKQPRRLMGAREYASYQSNTEAST